MNNDIINIYCDESCHLKNDAQEAMVLGAIICPQGKAKEINARIVELKNKYKMPRCYEAKWTKVSGSNIEFYTSLISLFFDDEDLRFRGWVVPDKSILDHNFFSQDHDQFYYKMYFHMLNFIINNRHRYHIYLDIKDTRSRKKAQNLHDVLANANYDFNKAIIKKIQHVRSHEIGLLQLADFFIGAVSYVARGLHGSDGKLNLIKKIQESSGLSLNSSTTLGEHKFNICYWKPNERISND